MKKGIIFLNDPSRTVREADVEFNNPTPNCLSIKGLEPQEGGFKLVNLRTGEEYTYSRFSTIYKVEGDKVFYSSDGSVYVKPLPVIVFNIGTGGTTEDVVKQQVADYADLEVPRISVRSNFTFLGWEPEIPAEGEIERGKTFYAKYSYEAPPVPIEQIREDKIAQFNTIQQQAINNGTDVELSDGSVEHFTATDADQRSLAALQAQVIMGSDAIPWHNSDKLEGCKYYSNEDMKKIIEGVTTYVTYHVTYFRDLRKIILLSEDRDFINSLEYGYQIPEEYCSDVLRDIYAAIPAVEETEE